MEVYACASSSSSSSAGEFVERVKDDFSFAISAVTGNVLPTIVFSLVIGKFFPEAVIGAICGALFFIQMDIIGGFLSGRLLREQLLPAIMPGILNQMNTIEEIEDGGTEGLPVNSIEKIPKINVEASGDTTGCPVCLEGFEMGETVRSLPRCRHIFHLSCIDRWLERHGSCPLCRRTI